MEGSFYEYIIVGIYDGEIRPLSEVIMNPKDAKKRLDIFLTYEHLKDRQLHILQRLVMAWEPFKEDINDSV